MAFHRRFAEARFLGDLTVCGSLSHLHHDAKFPVREDGKMGAVLARAFLHQDAESFDQPTGDVGMGHCPTVAHAVNRPHQIVRADVFEHVTTGPGFERAKRALLVRRFGEHDDLRLWTVLLQQLDGLWGGQSGHVLIEQYDVGIHLGQGAERLLNVRNVADDLDGVFALEQALNPLKNQGHVVYDHPPDVSHG